MQMAVVLRAVFHMVIYPLELKGPKREKETPKMYSAAMLSISSNEPTLRLVEKIRRVLGTSI